MQIAPHFSAQQMTDSLLGWWQLAGVDACIDEEPVDWFSTAKPRAVGRPAMQGEAHAAVPAPAALPDTLEAFHQWLADSTDLPEQAWAGPRILPTGAHKPRLMVIADMPEPAADADTGYLTDEADKLFGNMLRAMGVAREDSYICALAIRRPPGGMVADDLRKTLADRMLHQIGLVQPQGIMMLGDGTSRALVAADSSAPRQNLHFINHLSVAIPGIISFHPRLLLNQPAAKAESWRAMQALIGVWGH